MAIRASVFYPWKTFPFLTINQFEEECAIGREGNETTLHLENCTSYIGIRLPTLSGRGDSLDVQLGSVDVSSIHCLSKSLFIFAIISPKSAILGWLMSILPIRETLGAEVLFFLTSWVRESLAALMILYLPNNVSKNLMISSLEGSSGSEFCPVGKCFDRNSFAQGSSSWVTGGGGIYVMDNPV